MIMGDKAKFETMLNDLKKHGLDTVLFTNNKADRDAPLLEVSDRLGMNVFMLPAWDLYRKWWPNNIPATIENARAVAKPIVDLWSDHPSLKGYIVIDEPSTNEKQKVVLMTQALRELDPDRLVLMTLIGTNRVGPIFDAAKPDVMQIDVYPAALNNALCDFTMNGFAYPQYDFVSYIRTVTPTRPVETPLWMILQTHSFSGGIHSLRTPIPTEVRLQQWLALGEGATGIYWFVYSTQQSWIGLVDNKELYDEVKAQTARILPLRSLLLDIHKVADRFTASGAAEAYASTLESKNGERTFVIVANRDCQREQNITITASATDSFLKDVETGDVYHVGDSIPFKAGDGRIFEVLPGNQLYLPSVTNIQQSVIFQ